MHTHIHVACMHTPINTCMHTYIHTYVRTYVRECMHTYHELNIIFTK